MAHLQTRPHQPNLAGADAAVATSPPTVLHFVVGMGSGVETALTSWISAAPNVRHVVLASRDRGVATAEENSDAQYLAMPTGTFAAYAALRRELRRRQPDILHAHSTMAGFIARTLPVRDPPSIIYSPHCFAFERADLGRVARGAIRFVERALARRTFTFAVVSRHEARLVTTLSPKPVSQLSVAPSIPIRPDVAGHRSTSARAPAQIVGCGRLCAQKDPSMFAAVAVLVHRARPNVTFTWIGDGKDAYRRELESAGVAVTGWQTRQQTLNLLAQQDILLHTARWEGSPVVFDEAVLLGVIPVVRELDVFHDLNAPWMGRDAQELAAVLIGLIDRAPSDNRAPATVQTQASRIRFDLARTKVTLDELYRRGR